MGKVWTASGIVAPEAATVSLLDRGLLFGHGAFETLRSYQYRYFRLEEHLDRFFRNLELLHITIPLDRAALKQALQETVRAEGAPDARIKFLATGGAEGATQGAFFIHAEALTPFPETWYTEGARLVTSALVRCEANITTTLKSLAYLDSYWAREEAKVKGGDEGFFLNSKGMVSEGASSNIFIVKHGQVRTPALDQGVLPGVTRSFVLELSESLGFETVEGVVSLEDLQRADEVFITASIKEIMPVKTLDGVAVGKGRTVTRTLHQAYREKLPLLLSD